MFFRISHILYEYFHIFIAKSTLEASKTILFELFVSHSMYYIFIKSV